MSFHVQDKTQEKAGEQKSVEQYQIFLKIGFVAFNKLYRTGIYHLSLSKWTILLP